MTVRFPAEWCNTDLGEYRECAGRGRLALAGYQGEPLEDPQLSAYAEHYLTHRSDE